MADVNTYDEEKEQEEKTPCLGAKENSTHKMWTQRNVYLDLLMVGWGLGTWLGVNGLYVQLYLLVQELPESWALPASMSLAIQCANIGLLVYALLKRLLPRSRDSLYIYGLLSIGVASLTLNSFLYDKTVYLYGSNNTSIAFLILLFGAALVGCTSSVLFYPYLRHFREVYLATYLAGEGLSGFFPSIIALIQGIGASKECVYNNATGVLESVQPEPRFGVSVFMLLLAGLSAISLVSFTAIDNMGCFASERVAQAAADKNEEAAASNVSLLKPRWLGVLFLVGVLNFLSNGVLPSVQSYSCSPYGYQTYLLALTLSAMANPAACLAGVWLKPVSAKVLGSMLAVVLVPFVYIMVTALQSPYPPLYQAPLGSVIVIVAWIVTYAIVSYARMWVYGWARQGGAKGMRACGASTQLGSALGAIITFALVNFTGIFVQASECV